MRRNKNPTASMIQRLRVIIGDARQEAFSRNSSPSISGVMQQKKYLRRIAREPGLRNHLLGIGFNSEVRKFLKTESEGGATIEQILLWPKEYQQELEAINRERVFVPSRQEFVDLAPEKIKEAEVREAGEYLVKQGTQTIRVGRRLIRLSKGRWSKQQQKWA